LEGRPLDLRIVRAIVGAVREQDRSGFEIWRWLGATHGSDGTELTESTLYPTLHRMEAQRLIQGEWIEEKERTRRLYRVASKAAVLAGKRGWPAIERPLTRDPMAGEEEAGRPRLALPAAIPDFVERLAASLPLSEPSRGDVRNEIRDHLEDSVAHLTRLGRAPEEAVKEAISGLGVPEELAAAIAREERSRERLIRGMGSAGVSALFAAAVGIGGGALTILLAPSLASAITSLASGTGIHVYLPQTSEWRSQQTAAVFWVAAFLAARRSMPLVAQYSRRSVSAVRPIWALAGAVPLVAIALLAPANLDLGAAIGLLGIPVAFVLGTWRYQRPGDDITSRRGVAQAAVILALFLFLPGTRLWFYQTSSPTPDPAPVADSSARITISMHGVIEVSGLDERTWTDARVDLWPAARSGLQVIHDSSAQGPRFVTGPGRALTVESLPNPPAEWWVVLTAVDGTGTRRTLDVTVLASPPNLELESIFGWIVGSR
jgi:DNA-binding PadR family transcriptional regulator